MCSKGLPGLLDFRAPSHKAQGLDTPRKPCSSEAYFKTSEVHTANKAESWKGCAEPSTSTQDLLLGGAWAQGVHTESSASAVHWLLSPPGTLSPRASEPGSRSHLILRSTSRCSVTSLDSSGESGSRCICLFSCLYRTFHKPNRRGIYLCTGWLVACPH